MRPLVAPTEPAELKALGIVSPLPERVGCDVLYFAHGKKCGVQRKEVGDLLSSVADGRLGKELAQMAAANVAARLLVVEGVVTWTNEGVLLRGYGETWTRRQWLGLLWSAQEAGAWVTTTAGLRETCEVVEWFGDWCRREHRSLKTRPGPASMWGTRATQEEWACHVLQGFPGVGPALAARLVEEFGGVPLEWRVTREELGAVRGVGKKKVERIWALLNGGGAGRNEHVAG